MLRLCCSIFMIEAMVVIYYMNNTLLVQMFCTYIRLNTPNGGQLFISYIPTYIHAYVVQTFLEILPVS